jgi:transcriptional regulator with XRE-family HTH domain
LKKYTNIGELLVDYRIRNNLSQTELAAMLDVDSRTLLRWEKNNTLIKTEKEKELVNQTFIPYQVFRNLNAEVPIPVYYDFRNRMYSLTGLSKKFPEAAWFREQIEADSPRIRPIENEEDVENILRFSYSLYKPENPVDKFMILEAVKRFPELNLVITDSSGYYAGHSVFFPISMETYQQIKDKKIKEGQITGADLINYTTSSKPVFYAYSLSADCNENYFYMFATLLRFFKSIAKEKYLFAVLTIRNLGQSDFLNKMGLHKVWEDVEEMQQLNMQVPPTLHEGTFSAFLSGIE